MNWKSLNPAGTSVKLGLAALAIGWLGCCAGLAQTPPPALSPDLQEVVKLSQAQMSDDIITTYIRNSGKNYTLSADDLIYLKSHGVDQNVITTLQSVAASSQPAPSAPPPAPAPGPSPDTYTTTAPPGLAPGPGDVATAPPEQAAPAADVNYDYFHDQLAAYGSWVEVPGYGSCWRPDAALAANPDWRPYYDMGQWVYTDNGWFWQSDYSWGDIPFHYGNWISDPGYGWVWVPGYTWGPAWVFWREADADGCVGWAPLPPGAVFVDGGWFWHGVQWGVDCDFGLGANFFVFVGFDHFHDGFFRMRGHEYRFHVPRGRVNGFFHRSVLHNDFRHDDHGRMINDGIGRDRIERFTNRRENAQHFEERNPVGDRDRLAQQRNEWARQPGGHNFGQVNRVYRPPSGPERGGGFGGPRGGGGGGGQNKNH